MRKSESGQALVLILLSLSVVLTLVLFILSRSVTDVAISSTQEQAVRAFSAAEAGIERVLVTGGTYTAVSIGDNANYSAGVSSFAEGSSEFAYPFLFSSGDSATVWFKAHDANGDLTSTGAFTGSAMKVCWGTGTPSDSSPAVEVSIFYEATPGDLSTIRIARAAFDPYAGRSPANSFSTSLGAGSCPVAGKTFAFQKDITFSGFTPVVNTNGLLFARIRMFYNDTPQEVGVGVTGGFLPSQGQKIDSSGEAGGSNRRIVLYQGWPESPFTSNSLVVPAGITK